MVKTLDNPYTFRRVRERLWWWIRDRVGDKYEIVYEDTNVIVTLRNSRENIVTLTEVLNSAYRAGICDAHSLLEREKMASE
jgi:hypothetical protein